jgi:CRP-like cAMP-binding protein
MPCTPWHRGPCGAVVTVAQSGEEKVIERYGPGGVLGEIQLVLGGAWTTTVEAESPCLLYRLRRAVLDALSDREGELLEPLVGIIRSRLGRAQLAEVLPAFFGPLGPREIENFEEQAQWVTVRRGEALFRQGDPADGWYIVMSGRLQVLRRDELGDLKTLGELGRGESVGELSLLSGEPGVVTPYALRRYRARSFFLGEFPRACRSLPLGAQDAHADAHSEEHRRATRLRPAYIWTPPGLQGKSARSPYGPHNFPRPEYSLADA